MENKRNRQFRLGITGGIGSGKSYIASLLTRHFGIPVYDTDREAKRLTACDADIRCRLTKLTGTDLFEGGELIRSRLADYVFSSPEHAAQVNAIIHPAVLHDFMLWADGQAADVALESAILYESGFHKYVDKVLYVDAPEDIRLHRAMQRDGATEQQVMSRMHLQNHDGNRQHADFVIANDREDDTYLLEQLNEIIGHAT